MVIFTSDHGDLLGERGLWYKMSFYEPACRVPLIVSAPNRYKPRQIERPVSHVDLLPTLIELTGIAPPFDPPDRPDGHSLLPWLDGDEPETPTEVIGEYLGEGAIAPLVMIRRDRYKYVHCAEDPPQLYDLAADPDELHNLAADPDHAGLAGSFRDEVSRRWNLQALKQAVIADQDRRRLLHQALTQGQYTAWDYQPQQDASQRYMRNHLDLNELEFSSRFPQARAEGEFDT